MGQDSRLTAVQVEVVVSEVEVFALEVVGEHQRRKLTFRLHVIACSGEIR